MEEYSMEQRVLIAFDDSENAMRSIEFVVKNFNTDSRLTLFSILPDTAALCEMNSPELTPYFKSQQSNFCLLENKKKELIEQALEKAKQMLLDAGFQEDKIILKANAKKQGIARDIIEESKLGYDLIVIGRRGLSGIKEFIMGSVSQKVLSLSKDVSVLIVN
ncbi:MAG: universal stress protein [Desulfobacteraceae bacterium]|nr:universal stress protein [Desulfobacteraceae bacterium]